MLRTCVSASRARSCAPCASGFCPGCSHEKRTFQNGTNQMRRNSIFTIMIHWPYWLTFLESCFRWSGSLPSSGMTSACIVARRARWPCALRASWSAPPSRHPGSARAPTWKGSPSECREVCAAGGISRSPIGGIWIGETQSRFARILARFARILSDNLRQGMLHS